MRTFQFNKLRTWNSLANYFGGILWNDMVLRCSKVQGGHSDLCQLRRDILGKYFSDPGVECHV